MAKVTIRNLCKKFGEVVAVGDINLDFTDGRLTVLVGPSGCGKTTLLRILAGLEKPTSGEVYIGDKEVAFVPAWDRNIAMVFQSYALYPHMTVFKNMAFPLEARKMSKKDIKQQVQETAEVLGLTQLLNRYPRQLSGGQMQRVAIGRAIVRKPDLFLMDEPLSNLDAKLRVTMRAELKRLQRDLGVTTVYVTHDQAEAMTLADQLVVMKDGYVQQESRPEEVYFSPENVFVAGFIGSPPMNFIEGHLTAGGTCFIADCFTYELPPEVHAGLAGLPESKSVFLGIRPEDITVAITPVMNSFEGIVYIGEVLGKETLVTVKCGNEQVKAGVPISTRVEVGTQVWMRPAAEGLRIFDAKDSRILFNGAVITGNGKPPPAPHKADATP